MIEVKLKRTRISTALTFLSSSAPDLAQRVKNIEQWATQIPRLLIIGDVKPPMLLGVRWLQAPADPPIRNLLGSYMVSVPGSEICLLAAPEFELGGSKENLLKRVDENAMEMTWACHSDNQMEAAPAPKLFVFSAPVLAHMIQDIPPNVRFTPGWELIIHKWMEAMMRHRYFDASELGLPVFPDVPMPKPISEDANRLPKRGRPKKK